MSPGPTGSEPAPSPAAPRDLTVTAATVDNFSISWQPPSDPEGLLGYRVYVRDHDQEVDLPVGTTEATLAWPYIDTTHPTEVWVAAVYPDGDDGTAEAISNSVYLVRPESQDPDGEGASPGPSSPRASSPGASSPGPSSPGPDKEVP